MSPTATQTRTTPAISTLDVNKASFITALEEGIALLMRDELEILQQFPQFGAISRVSQTGPGTWTSSSVCGQYIDVHKARVTMQKDLAFIKNHDWNVKNVNVNEIRSQNVYAPDIDQQPF